MLWDYHPSREINVFWVSGNLYPRINVPTSSYNTTQKNPPVIHDSLFHQKACGLKPIVCDDGNNMTQYQLCTINSD